MTDKRVRFVGPVHRRWLAAAIVALFVLIGIVTRLMFGPDPLLPFLVLLVVALAAFGLMSWMAHSVGELTTAEERKRRLAKESLERPLWHHVLMLCVVTAVSVFLSSLFSERSIQEMWERTVWSVAYLVFALPLIVPLAAIVAYIDREHARARLAKLGN